MRYDIANMSVVAPGEDQSDEVLLATANDLDKFIRAGGVIDFQTWSQLNEYSKDVLVGAEFERRVEMAYMVAVAAGEYGPEKVWAMLDDGELLKDKVAEELSISAAIRAAGALQGESVPDIKANTP